MPSSKNSRRDGRFLGRRDARRQSAKADARGAKLAGVILENANLSEANFTDANLEGAVLSGAKAAGAQFENATMTGAVYDEATLSRIQLEKTVKPSYVAWSDAELAEALAAHLAWIASGGSKGERIDAEQGRSQQPQADRGEARLCRHRQRQIDGRRSFARQARHDRFLDGGFTPDKARRCRSARR